MTETLTSPTKKSFGINGSTLKLIAVFTMLIDHFAASVLEGKLMSLSSFSNDSVLFIEENNPLLIADRIMRFIGRPAFPIFCFLLVEGFTHTSNLRKYISRMAFFALISEIPFDLALWGKIIEPRYQNVYFTLLIGLIVMALLQYAERRFLFNRPVCTLCYFFIILGGMAICELLKTDYGALGILTIAVMYFFRKNALFSMLTGCTVLTVFNSMEACSFFALLPLKFYNGKRGFRMKYFFYFFYPVHLLLLFLICRILGIR